MFFSTRNRKLLTAGGAVILIALYYVATFPDLESGAETAASQNERWELAVVERPRQPDVDAMLEGGFWGQRTGSGQEDENEEGSIEQLAEAEAAEIRKRIVGIVSAGPLPPAASSANEPVDTGEGMDERLAVLYENERLVTGDVLTGTYWELVSIGRDRLILEQPGQGQKEMKLFDGNAISVAETAPAGARPQSVPAAAGQQSVPAAAEQERELSEAEKMQLERQADQLRQQRMNNESR